MKHDYSGNYDGDLWQAVVNNVMELEVLSDVVILLAGSYKQPFSMQLVKNKS